MFVEDVCWSHSWTTLETDCLSGERAQRKLPGQEVFTGEAVVPHVLWSVKGGVLVRVGVQTWAQLPSSSSCVSMVSVSMVREHNC